MLRDVSIPAFLCGRTTGLPPGPATGPSLHPGRLQTLRHSPGAFSAMRPAIPGNGVAGASGAGFP